jgi:hypothetical protein
VTTRNSPAKGPVTTNLLGRTAHRAPRFVRWDYEAWPTGMTDTAEIVEVYRTKPEGRRPSRLFLSLVDENGRTGTVDFERVRVTLASPLTQIARM